MRLNRASAETVQSRFATPSNPATTRSARLSPPHRFVASFHFTSSRCLRADEVALPILRRESREYCCIPVLLMGTAARAGAVIFRGFKSEEKLAATVLPAMPEGRQSPR
jgi:hypothetical protein